MLFSSRFDSSRRGQGLICLGVSVVIVAQFWTTMPIVATIVLVGWGTTLSIHSTARSTRQDVLSLANLSVYATLTCLAIVAQSHLELQQGPSRVQLTMLLDHAAAIMMLFALATHVFRRVCQPTAQDG